LLDQNPFKNSFRINQSISQSIMPFPRDKSTFSQSSVQVKNKEYNQISEYTDAYTRVTAGKEERLIFSAIDDLHFLLRTVSAGRKLQTVTACFDG